MQDRELAELAQVALRRLRLLEAEPTPAEKWTYKLKIYVQVLNETGEQIHVERPNGWLAAEAILQGPQAEALAASTLDLWDNKQRKWVQGESKELDVPPGAKFRFWLGIEPAIGLSRLRALRSQRRVGRFTLPVTIGGRRYPWGEAL